MTTTSNLLDFYKQHLESQKLAPMILAQAGIGVPHSRLIRNPTYPDRNPSAYVYDTHVTDYGHANGSGKNTRYDNLALCREWLGLGFEQSIDLLCSLAGIGTPERARNSGVQVKAVQYAPLPEQATRDPHEFAAFAEACEAALHAQRTPEAERAAAWLESRQLACAALLLRLGVVDATVREKAPHMAPDERTGTWGSVWREHGFVTFPSWEGDRLAALKGRSPTDDKKARMMRNIKGARTALYGLDMALQHRSRWLWVVEGETDTCSVVEAYGGDVAVVGIVGAGNWVHLGDERLRDRKLLIAVDTDSRGIEASGAIWTWAREAGRDALVVPVGDDDKSGLLRRLGPEGLRDMMRGAARHALDLDRIRRANRARLRAA